MTVTRRHHPLEGQQFEVLLAGREHLAIRLKDGSSMRIPRAWTDADGAQARTDPQRTPSALTGVALRELVELLDALRGRGERN